MSSEPKDVLRTLQPVRIDSMMRAKLKEHIENSGISSNEFIDRAVESMSDYIGSDVRNIRLSPGYKEGKPYSYWMDSCLVEIIDVLDKRRQVGREAIIYTALCFYINL